MPSVRSTSQATQGNTGASFTCTKPTGTVSGDVLIAYHCGDVGVLANMAASGGTAWNTLATTGSDSTLPGKVYWKVAGGSEPASYTFSQDSGADACAAIICISGASTDTPTVATGTDGFGTNIDTPSAIAPGSADIDVRFVSAGGSLTTSESVTPPATYTEFADTHSRQYIYVSGAHKTLAASGATGIRTFTITTAPGGRRGVTVIVTDGTTATPLTETAAGADDLSASAAAPLAETSAGVDALAAAVATDLTEAAAGVDVLAVAVSVALTDGTVGDDNVSGGVPIDLTDTSTGVDDLAALPTPTVDEQAAGVDQLAVAAATGLTETVAGNDALAASEIFLKSFSDSGSSVDALSVIVLEDITVTTTGLRRDWGARSMARDWIGAAAASRWAARPPTT